MAIDGAPDPGPLSTPAHDPQDQLPAVPSMASTRYRMAMVTCRELADLDPDDRLALAPLADLGIMARPEIWDDPAADWSGYDLVVLRSPWDYAARRSQFVAWAQGLARLLNPAAVVAWNTDKRYLARLADAGLPVVPTEYLEPAGPPWLPPQSGRYVVKPLVGAGSIDTGSYDLADPEHRRLAGHHVTRLCASGRTVMIQPYLPAVDTAGETALIYFAGQLSHAIRKGPMLDGPDLGEPGLYKVEQIDARAPTRTETELGRDVLDVACRQLGIRPDDLLYARVDLIPGEDAAPLLVELELTEPSLFLGTSPGAPARFAAAIKAWLDRG